MRKFPYRAVLAGAAGGIANGLFGAGGGMILVPLLQRWVKLDDRDCFTTALAIIFPMCLVSIGVYFLQGAMPLRDAIPFLVGGLLGGLLGGILFPKIPTKWLHRALGILILWGGIRLLL